MGLAERGVRVVAITPGRARTPILARFSDELNAFMASEQLRGRLTEPEEIAEVGALRPSDRPHATQRPDACADPCDIASSHTPRLDGATARFRATLAGAETRRPPPGAPRLVSGLDGAPVFDAAAGREKLALQISRTIDWAACLDACREYGADRVIELGPGHALATMAEAALPGARVHTLEAFRSRDGVRTWIGRP